MQCLLNLFTIIYLKSNANDNGNASIIYLINPNQIQSNVSTTYYSEERMNYFDLFFHT